MGEGKYTRGLVLSSFALLAPEPISQGDNPQNISRLHPSASELSHEHLLKTLDYASDFLIGIYYTIIPWPQDVTFR